MQERTGGSSGEVVSVCVEHGSVKMMVSEGTDVVDYRISKVDPLFFREGLASDTLQIGQVIRAALDEMVDTPTRVIGAVPGYQTTLTQLELPASRGMNPEVVIPRQMNDRMGISPETPYLTWRRLPANVDRSRWMVLSATRRSIRSLIGTVEAAGITVSALELRAFALARAINRSDAVIAWTSTDGCDVVIVRDSMPAAHQSAFWGAESVDGSVLANRLTDIVGRTIEAYDSEERDLPLPPSTPLFVTGSAATPDASMAVQVASNLQRRAEVADPPLSLPMPAPGFPVDDLIINLGLALWYS